MTSGPVSDSELLDLVGDIYDCAIEPTKWPTVLERIARMLDGAHAAISLQRPVTNTVSLRAHWNVDPAFERSMVTHFAINPAVPCAWYMRVDEPFSFYDAIGADELKATRWHRQAVASHGFGDCIATVLAKTSQQFGTLSLCRDDWKPPYGAAELEILRALAPHVRRAALIADMLDARALERSMLAAALDRLAVGVVLTDGDGRIVHVNEAATRYLDDGNALRRIGDQLAVGDPASARDLAQAIAEAASGTTIDIPRSGIVVPLKRRGGGDLAAWVLPLDHGLRQEFGAGFAAKVAVFIRDLGDTSPFPAELFVRRFAITPAECRLLVLLVQGMTVTEAADTLGISLPTARTHLAHLFEKTGTSRQIDLVRLAMRALSPVS
ncbi:LuxR C-terminal-related transcriptional regulator [Hyphomicrobium sp.]|uniref:LuxR C-terminal-related transcriptional regulator n=1 Tax=Hyphomicrobium sp. TaxID=82 RepID=UPI0025C5BDFD|nr:LuxR C-terminal-related transcriptional regulator [Hyphomicrobium sp.]MCC7253579.1 PAS domain-containing protein [Hyphomicrobium sp.]